MNKTSRLGLVALLSLVVLVGLPFVIPMDGYRQELAQRLTERFGQPVTVASLRPSLLPVTGVTVEGIAFADGGRLDRVDVPLDLGALLHGRVEIPSLRVTGGELPLRALVGIAARDAGGGGVGVRELRLRNLTLRHGEAQLGPFAADIPLGGEVGFHRSEIHQNDGSLSLHLLPTPEGIQLTLVLDHWHSPLPPRLVIDRLRAEGVLHEGRITLSALEGAAYGGTLGGGGELSWGEGWRLAHRFNLKGVALEPLLKALGEPRRLSGRLDADGNLALSADDPARLFHHPELDADFVIHQGVLHNADLEQAARNLVAEEQKGGETPFERCAGHLALRGGDLALGGLTIASTALEAAGGVKVRGLNELEGEIDVGLKGAAMIASIPLHVGGTVAEPSLRLTNEAIAGAGAGSAILGPGIGTAVGIKAGQLVKGLTRALGGGEEEEKEVRK
ncbi:AsmA family protein [Endothiovibrio diazotrophicus]